MRFRRLPLCFPAAAAPGFTAGTALPAEISTRASDSQGRPFRRFLPLRGSSVFVAVGSPHLHRPKPLLVLLREQGYRVRRVF
jgi:uncharacterized protein YbaP (TraB family)